MKIILAFLIAAAAFKSSAAVVYYNYTVAFSFLIQDNGSTTTATKFKIATKDLLAYLSQSEFYAGNYSASAFPTGARLAYEYNQETSEGRFVVQDSTRAIICDVSDLLTLNFGVDVNIASTATSYYQEQMVFDNTGVGLDLSFQASYETAEKTSKGIATCKGTTGTGDGILGTRNLVITGACSSTTK